jgi:sugar O-acyltransferase (sialic acid O-acetyltransferase NeuD family)
MLIIGCGGLGKEILTILIEDHFSDEIVFYDEGPNAPDMLYGTYRVLKDLPAVEAYFRGGDRRFITGIGNPRIREMLTTKIETVTGYLDSVISKRTTIFHFNDKYSGVIIQPGVGISHNVRIEKGAAIHINATIGHSTSIGKYVNVGPNATIIGPVEIGAYSYISAQAVVLPNITIGKNVIVSAGKVVNRSLADYETL